jgi:hypothetical protein
MSSLPVEAILGYTPKKRGWVFPLALPRPWLPGWKGVEAVLTACWPATAFHAARWATVEDGQPRAASPPTVSGVASKTKYAVVLACLACVGCAVQQPAPSGPASLQLVPPGYYSVKPRYTSRPARVVRETEPPARTTKAPAAPSRINDGGERAGDAATVLDALAERAAELSEQLETMRRQIVAPAAR